MNLSWGDLPHNPLPLRGQFPQVTGIQPAGQQSRADDQGQFTSNAITINSNFRGRAPIPAVIALT